VSLRAEIFEQPEVLERLLVTQAETAGELASAIRARGARWMFVAARGTSDNAAVYAKYVWGARNRLPVALAAPSLFTLYRTPPRIADAVVVGISQSGQSPDIVGVVAEGRRQGALTLAVTNDPTSPLAAEAEWVIDLGTGPERAVAATKTYTAQLLAVALLSAAMAGDDVSEALAAVPGLVGEALGLDGAVEAAVGRFREMGECVVLGRGFEYATAHEWALKLKELTLVGAEPYSSADFRHGPVAIVGPGFTLLAAVPAGAVFDDVLALLTDLVEERGAELVAVSNEPRALALASTPLPLPAGLPEWLGPLVSIVPAQLFCYHLARARGLDPDAPRGLHKVTRTW
jgi:glucosamine--fructose-6-phosphate aminotransferase (isomerizing)